MDDPEDPVLRPFRALTDRLHRHEEETFVAEGFTVLGSLVASAHPIESVLAATPRVERARAILGDRAVPLYEAPLDVLREVTGFNIHRGLLAIGRRLPLPDPAALLRGARVVLGVEAVNDLENLGALFRNAAAFGVDAVLLDDRCADPLYRRCLRVSMGHALHVPWTRVDSWDVVRTAGLPVAALTPGGSTTVDAFRPPVAWLVGAEGPGLDPATLAAADHRVSIPMAPGVDSLNVATAAAVALAFTRTSPRSP